METSPERNTPAVEAVRRARAFFDREGDPRDFHAFEAFVLRSRDARTYEEVAAVLGMSVPEVRARVLRVRERIRTELKGASSAPGSRKSGKPLEREESGI